MNKKLKVTISIIASMIIILGSAFTIYAATTDYSLKSHGIIAHDGDGDGAYTNTAKDIYIDSGDLKTINDAVVAGKTSLASAINSATASSATNKTTLGTTDANLPAFNDLKNAIANVKAAGNEEGIITGQNNVINNVGGKTSASLGADGSLTLSYDGTTGTSSVGNPTWAAIENKLSGKTDSAGNPIYSGITNLDSLENAITRDNDNCRLKFFISDTFSCTNGLPITITVGFRPDQILLYSSQYALRYDAINTPDVYYQSYGTSTFERVLGGIPYAITDTTVTLTPDRGMIAKLICVKTQ